MAAAASAEPAATTTDPIDSGAEVRSSAVAGRGRCIDRGLTERSAAVAAGEAWAHEENRCGYSYIHRSTAAFIGLR